MADDKSQLSKIEANPVEMPGGFSVEKGKEKIIDQDRKRYLENRLESMKNVNLEESKGTKEMQAGSASMAIGGLTAEEEKRIKEIENVLESDLKEIYIKMTPENQQEFKRVGEETAQQINTLLKDAKVKVGKIIDLIRNWLKIIPGVNKFFLEQEAKIKADALMKIRDENQF